MFVPGGLVWIAKWRPSPPPYFVLRNYPFGDYAESWQVAMGFAFVAFGLLFAAASGVAGRTKSRSMWVAMLVSWLLLMFPHAFIGVTFAIEDPSLKSLGISAYVIPFAALWGAVVAAGFILSGRDVWRQY
jgi:hypothetical protein